MRIRNSYASEGQVRRMLGAAARGLVLVLTLVLGMPAGVQAQAGGQVDAAVLGGNEAPAGNPAANPAQPKGGAAATDDAIVLNFEGADIREVIHSLAGALEINYLIDPRVEGQVTIRTTGKIPRSELFPVFNQILRSIGIAAVRVGEVYNIVPIAEAKTRVIVSRDELQRMTEDDLFVVELLTVENIAAPEMATLLQPFITPGGDVIPYPRANMLILTDIASNVDRLREMIQLLDRDAFRDLKARIFKIRNTNLEELGQELLMILDTYGITGQAASERGVYAIPLFRLNSIAVLAFAESTFEAVEYWLGILDVKPDAEMKKRVRTYQVQNAKAQDLAQILNELYGGGGGGNQQSVRRGQPGFGGVFGGRGATANQGGARNQRNNAGGRRAGGMGRGQSLGEFEQFNGGSRGGNRNSSRGGSRGGIGGSRGGARPAGVLAGGSGGAGASSVVISGGAGSDNDFISDVRIVADQITNSLVVFATKTDWEEIRAVILDLDTVPRQVVIEVLIAEVRLNKGMSLGIRSIVATNLSGVPQPTGGGDTSGLSAISQAAAATAKRYIESDFLSGDPKSRNGFSALITDGKHFEAAIKAEANAGRAKILASPHILTADNREASINIGSSVPVLTQTANVPGIQQGGSTALVNSVQYRDTGVILNILPQVNADGLVNLKIRQEVSAVDGSAESSTGSPTFIVREVETTGVVQDGDTLLIGGIIQELTDRSRAGIPYLMDIPVLGQLFRYESSSSNKTELIIMITPHVIRGRAEGLEVTQRYKDRLWDVVDEIERTGGLRPPSRFEMDEKMKLRGRTTTAERPQAGFLPNRDWED
jgi:general secretion pathway protein D